MTSYLGALALMAGTIAVCNAAILLFRHPRLPRWIGSELVAMLVGVLLTMAVFFAYALAVIQIAGSPQGGNVTWAMAVAAGQYLAVVLVVSAAMGMRQRLGRASGRSTPTPAPAGA